MERPLYGRTTSARRRTAGRPLPAPVPKAVIYARVSSKDQDREGFSIPSQMKLLREYAANNGLLVAEEFIDVETAKHVGRTNFMEMVRYVAKRQGTAILVEKTDRLYRNMKDYVTLDDLGADIHFVKEGTLLTRDSRSSEKFMHGIKVLMAKNYIDNLSEEARKGMLEKAEQGNWPSAAPIGYRNIVGPDGKRVIEVDPVEGPIVARAFALYSSGRLSLRDVTEQVRSAGLRYRKSGTLVTTSAVHLILRRRLYCGEFEWNGRIYQGKHEPLVPPSIWLQVQGVLNGRHAGVVKTENDFAFAGLVTCGHCGCLAVAEVKKKKYVYYHCSGARGKCGEPYIREEALAAKFGEHLDRLQFPPGAFDRFREAMKESMVDVEAERARAVRHLQAEYERIATRLATLYADKVDGTVDATFYETMSTQWRETQIRVLHEIETHHIAAEDHIDDVLRLLDLAQNARGLFENASPTAQRRLLELVTSNSTYAHGELTVEFRTPFDLIEKAAPSLMEATGQIGRKVRKGDQAVEWLGN